MADRIAEIEERWKGATKGPWWATGSRVLSHQAPQWAVAANPSGHKNGSVAVAHLHPGYHGQPVEEDARAIAAAPEDVTYLLRVAKVAAGYFAACYYANQGAGDWCLDSIAAREAREGEGCGECHGCKMHALLLPYGEAEIERLRALAAASPTEEGTDR